MTALFFFLNHQFITQGAKIDWGKYIVSQTSFGHISTNSSMILTVSMATESPWKDLSIDTSHALKWSVLAEILGRSTGNHYGTVY